MAVVTAGPGVTDSVSGVAEAFTAGIPMIEFGGRPPLRDFDRGTLQDIDQVRLMEPITKWAKAIYEARRIPEYVSTAFRLARSGTPGPVYLAIIREWWRSRGVRGRFCHLSCCFLRPGQAAGDPPRGFHGAYVEGNPIFPRFSDRLGQSSLLRRSSAANHPTSLLVYRDACDPSRCRTPELLFFVALA